MIFTDRQIVWMPITSRGGVAIALNRSFAEACIAHTSEDMDNFILAVWRYMGERTHSCRLDIHKGIFPKGIYAEKSGLWLEMDTGTIAGSTRVITYHSHNADLTADQFFLIRSFQAWADAAMAALDWK